MVRYRTAGFKLAYRATRWGRSVPSAPALPHSMMTGYLHPAYAESLSEFGRPRLLPRSRGWILERPIPACPYFDAMGCYPLFTCHDWSELPGDLVDLGSELVSLF